ncbi:hypothetical protein FQA39_LY14883 [Lamprigera yunnana]|nr:hypothetical protein FQA39_LY14883 [Lamprigera yunnana]
MESSPGFKALVHADKVFKKPTNIPKKRAKQKVLDEETYIEEMGKIIQRDFFPDLEKLKAQHDYLEAKQRNDVAKLRELYAKYSGPKPPLQRIPSPATFETPANIHNSQVTPNIEEAIHVEKIPKEKRLSLDQFLNSHTSQDNESFEEIMLESEKKHREKFSFLYKEEDKSQEEIHRHLELQKPKLHNVRTRRGDLTMAEKVEMSKKRQEVVHINTRLQENPFNEDQSKETINELAKNQAKILDGKIGVDGKEVMPPDIPNVNGFSFVRTPSPRPGVTDTPLMTWGEIEGTPFRLDGSDTPLLRTPGPSFKMAEPPRREQIALALAEKVSERHRDQKKKRFIVQSPRPNSSSIDRLATMSPAARRLATSRLKLGDLRTLSPSPIQRLRTPGTPRRIHTPKLNLGIKKAVNDNLTDDLLNINVPKRQKASDFF